MRALHLEVSERELEDRHRLGLDKLDEMWEGELHMVPPPTAEHQDIVTELAVSLVGETRRRALGRITVQLGVFHTSHPDTSYRIPDLVFVGRANAGVRTGRGVVGAADAVIEVRSPGDETYEKFTFFAEIGIREVIVIDRDTRRPEVFRLVGGKYFAVAADASGWVASDVLGVRFVMRTDPPRLCVEPLDRSDLGVEI